MLVQGASSSLDLRYWLFELLGLREKTAPISDQSNTLPLLHHFILLLPIVVGFGWLLYQLPKNSETNPNAIEVDDQGEEGNLCDELDHYFQFDQLGEHQPLNGDGDDQHLSVQTAVPGGGDGRRHGACAFCGNLSTTRCSRCKAARYCSMKCQIRHWRSGHKNECCESESAADEANPSHDDGTSKLVKKSDREGISNEYQDEVKWSLETFVGEGVSRDNDVNNFHGCEMCGSRSTARCSRCKVVKYCSLKCLIMNWRWHKDRCFAWDVGVTENSHKKEETVHSSAPLSLEFNSEGTTDHKFSVKVPQDLSKEAHLLSTERVRYLEDKETKSRNEILVLQSECDEWKKRANFAREKFQRLKKESNYQLFMLKKENVSLSNAEKITSNAIRSLHERINQLQNEIQESKTDKRKLKERIQILESESVKLKKELKEEHKRAQCLIVECNKSHETAQIAIKEVELVRQELKNKCENTQQLRENFHRDVTFLESRATFAEAKLNDLYRKIKLSDYKVCSVCLSSEKDLAFGCGHMTCRECGSKLSKCPICREEITNHIKLFPG